MIPKKLDIIFINWYSTVFAKKTIDDFLQDCKIYNRGSTYFYESDMFIGFVNKYSIDDKDLMSIDLVYPKNTNLDEKINVNDSNMMDFAKDISARYNYRKEEENIDFRIVKRENDYRITFSTKKVDIAVYFRPGYPDHNGVVS